ncbi:hypothetical protein NUW58_g7314 [Xylaria curta]|uniref:Uncharacterized protein n=1 Tax=Xylaria curta TaxID=42375 RepID=A0ACC1NK83_9PEZI|nr:hypothetical protein NUW58_g7314 [Xylaria curta]
MSNDEPFLIGESVYPSTFHPGRIGYSPAEVQSHFEDGSPGRAAQYVEWRQTFYPGQVRCDRCCYYCLGCDISTQGWCSECRGANLPCRNTQAGDQVSQDFLGVPNLHEDPSFLDLELSLLTAGLTQNPQLPQNFAPSVVPPGLNPQTQQIQNLQNPSLQNPQYQNPEHQNLEYQNPQYQNPQYQNPQYQNPQYQNPQYQNPQYQNFPNPQVPQYQNPPAPKAPQIPLVPQYQTPGLQNPPYQDFPNPQVPQYQNLPAPQAPQVPLSQDLSDLPDLPDLPDLSDLQGLPDFLGLPDLPDLPDLTSAPPIPQPSPNPQYQNILNTLHPEVPQPPQDLQNPQLVQPAQDSQNLQLVQSNQQQQVRYRSLSFPLSALRDTGRLRGGTQLSLSLSLLLLAL